jgi:diaminopimelate epimerase
MTPFTFVKYQGAGNDFVLVDQRRERWLTRGDRARVARLCDRRFGIGADGLILLEPREGYDFEMIYFNADGGESSLCGNGGRCIAAFARHLGLVAGQACSFLASDGRHEARITRSLGPGGEWVELKMADVVALERTEDGRAFVLDTGSPHYVRFVPDGALPAFDVVGEGRAVRYGERFRTEGINVNFACAAADGALDVRTYERGVEDETLACGTGVTAAALAAYAQSGRRDTAEEVELPVHARGGDLIVRFRVENGVFTDIWLCGPAQRVFEGRLTEWPADHNLD